MWEVSHITHNKQGWIAEVNANESIEELEAYHPAERILTDSKRCSFIYVMEDEEQFNYLLFPINTWETIQNGIEEKEPMYLKWVSNSNEEKVVKLGQFWEELDYLLENIRGNGNYGNEMVEAVERVFFAHHHE
ncbi:hypothetical protein [Texcoconibacillus texcoconensis]|nr:hypothetical protein [Texcoconibacillus texcoconensis]